MYIIRNKIRVICSKIRVGMGGSIFHRGIWTPGSIFRGAIFNMTPVSTVLCNLSFLNKEVHKKLSV